VPETAAVASQTAAREQPGLAAAIARAAVVGAPTHAAEVVRAVCGVVPGEYRSIAIGAAGAAPSASRDILRAVGSVRAELKQYIERELPADSGAGVSVTLCLDRAQMTQSRSGTPMPPGPPQPIGPKPLGGEILPGGRNYARP
jgi:hypothetical protein